MTALLYTQNIYAKIHQGLRAKFLELFIKTQILPVETSGLISVLFDYRQQADYDLDSEISLKEEEVLIKKAIEFYSLTNTYFQKAHL
jgi:uncharacterized protein (UPF0332 family)